MRLNQSFAEESYSYFSKRDVVSKNTVILATILTASLFTFNLVTAFLRPNYAAMLGTVDLVACIGFFVGT